MKRTDLFLSVHSDLRVAMFATAVRLARADVADPAAADAAFAQTRRVLGLLRDHAQHEERSILPVLRRHCPELATGLASEHQLIAGQEARLALLLDQMSEGVPARRSALASRLQGQWHRVMAHHLVHMQREEEEANRVLQAHYSDVELEVLRDAPVPASLSAELQQWAAGGVLR